MKIELGEEEGINPGPWSRESGEAREGMAKRAGLSVLVLVSYWACFILILVFIAIGLVSF